MKHFSIPLTVLGTSIFSICLFYFMAHQTDSISFINAVTLLLGESAEPDRLFRLSKPIPLLFPAFLHQLLGISIANGFLAQQLIAYYLSAYCLYQILAYVFEKKEMAFMGMLAYILCQPVAVYGLAVLSDGLGWLSAIWGLWLCLQIFEKENPAPLQVVALGVYFGIGMFIKESIIITGLFTFLLILLKQDYSWKRKIGYNFLIGIAFLMTLLLGSYFVFLFSGQSLLQWLKFGHDSPPHFSLKDILLQSYHTYDVYWLFIIIGISSQCTTLFKNTLLLTFLLTACLGLALLLLVWPYHYDRILFLTAPFMLVWIVIGANKFGKMALPLIFIGGLMNLLVAWGIYKYQLKGLLLTELAVFLLLILLSTLYNKSQDKV